MDGLRGLAASLLRSDTISPDPNAALPFTIFAWPCRSCPKVERQANRSRQLFSNLGRLLAEFSQFPKLTPDNVSERVEYEGLDNYLDGLRRGRGVLFLTAHVGAWELSSFAHGLYGYPMKFLTRPLDNPLVQSLITDMRTLSGNHPIDRNGATREVLKALRNNETIGILIDQNTIRVRRRLRRFLRNPSRHNTGAGDLRRTDRSCGRARLHSLGFCNDNATSSRSNRPSK